MGVRVLGIACIPLVKSARQAQLGSDVDRSSPFGVKADEWLPGR
jgi:hypothetical protein